MKALENVLQRLAEVGLKVNTEKSLFGWTETEYLWFWVSKTRIIPLSSKVDGIKVI